MNHREFIYSLSSSLLEDALVTWLIKLRTRVCSPMQHTSRQFLCASEHMPLGVKVLPISNLHTKDYHLSPFRSF
jgi:hypothetical protein